MNNAHRLSIAIGAAATAMVFSTCTYADDDDDERGRGKGRGREHKEEYWDGNCKVKRKWEKDGRYKEERECEGRDRRHGDEHRTVVVRPYPVAVPAPVVVYPPWVVQQQGQPVYRSGREPAPQRGRAVQCNSDSVGRVLGGIAGAVLGNQIGKDSNRAVATIGGGIAGVLIGGEIGRRIDRNNQACIGRALEFAPTGQRVEWSDTNGGERYAVIPGPVVNRGGAQCRPYEAFVHADGSWQKTVATACRRSDGVWLPAG